jgi:hypothetical protein
MNVMIRGVVILDKIYFSKFAKDHFFYSALLLCICNECKQSLNRLNKINYELIFMGKNENGSVP